MNTHIKSSKGLGDRDENAGGFFGRIDQEKKTDFVDSLPTILTENQSANNCLRLNYAQRLTRRTFWRTTRRMIPFEELDQKETLNLKLVDAEKRIAGVGCGQREHEREGVWC